MADDDTAIKVSVRIRPLNKRELDENLGEGFTYSSTAIKESTTSGEKLYHFDHCFDPNTQNEEAYAKVREGGI